MSAADTRPLFTDAHPRPTAPSINTRNETVELFDRAGQPHKVTRANAREALEKSGWTTDPVEGEKRRLSPLPPIVHVNPELGPGGRTPRYSIPRTSSPVINGVAQFEVTAPAAGE